MKNKFLPMYLIKTSIPILGIALSILLFTFSNKFYFYTISFDNNVRASIVTLFLSITFLFVSILFFGIITYSYLKEFKDFNKKKHELLICENCKRDMMHCGYEKIFIDLKICQYKCKKCGAILYRKGCF